MLQGDTSLKSSIISLHYLQSMLKQDDISWLLAMRHVSEPQPHSSLTEDIPDFLYDIPPPV